MRSRWDLGDRVRVTRNVRNDGTYPAVATGDLLIRRGAVGAVIDIGTFLQDQIIYSIHFMDDDRIVGCREEELIDGDDAWRPSKFEVRERVAARKILALDAHSRVPRGAFGEVLRVLNDVTDNPLSAPVVYHVHFDCLAGRTLAVPETALASLAEASIA